MTDLPEQGFLDIAGHRIEFRMIGPRPHEAATIVLLHEGLGCVAMWNDFPERLAQQTGAGVFVYSRAGYGRSSPARLPRPVSYMHEEALTVFPELLEAIGFRRGLLVGHSDGASIATIYAGNVEDHRVRGLVLIAPHFFTEDSGIAAIAAAGEAYRTTDLRERLARYHAEVDNAFRGWNDVWLDPAFRAWDITEELAYIRVPILIVQGEDDQYGTARQISVAQEECYCPVETALLPGVKHSPHREAPDQTLDAIAGFANRLLRDHHEGDLAAA
jgi:pimeloyl-ACP methyl ester carboxylesterase